VVLLFALFMHLQLYPRADFMHLLGAAPLSLVFAGYLLDRALDAWGRGFAAHGALAARHVLSAALTLLVVAAIAVAVTPGQRAVRLPDRFVLPFAVSPVGVEQTSAADLRDLAVSATHLGTLVGPGGESLAFPAASLALFLIGARNPGPHDYFFAGRPDHREEAEILDRLAARPPNAMLSLNSRFSFFYQAPAYYFLLRRFVRDGYVLAGRYGRYDVLAARSPRSVTPRPATIAPAPADAAIAPAAAVLAGGAPLVDQLAAVTTLAGAPLATAAPPLLLASSGDSAVLRQAALVALLDLLARAPAQGLEDYVQAAGLDRGQHVRLLRTVRDLRDPRAASYLFATLRSGDARIATDALWAMRVTRDQMVARRHLWAGSEAPDVWPARDAVLVAVRAVLADPLADPRAVAFAAQLAGMMRDAGSVPALRDRWRAETPAPGPRQTMLPPTGPDTLASVADALAVLAPQGIVCELVGLLASPLAPLRELVPTTILGLAHSEEPVRSRVRSCLGAALGIGGPAQAEAVWIAAVLDDPALVPGVLGALTSLDPSARRAAAWALGEIDAPSAATEALDRAGREDADAIVRSFAAGALAKRAGRAPRVFPRPPHGVPARGARGES
jgi:hypothetical protein